MAKLFFFFFFFFTALKYANYANDLKQSNRIHFFKQKMRVWYLGKKKQNKTKKRNALYQETL